MRSYARQEKLPEGIQDALNKGLLKRLPLTFLPFVNQQLNQWEYLFPNERQSTERLLLHVASLTPEQPTALFRDVVELEEKMGVRQWQFSTSEQTIRNSSQTGPRRLQDSAASRAGSLRCLDEHALKTGGAGDKTGNRLVLMDIRSHSHWMRPAFAPVGRKIGRPVNSISEHPAAKAHLSFSPAARRPQPAGVPKDCSDAFRKRLKTSHADAWLISGKKRGSKAPPGDQARAPRNKSATATRGSTSTGRTSHAR